MHHRGSHTASVASSTLFLLDSCVIVFMASAEEVMGDSYAKIKFVKLSQSVSEGPHLDTLVVKAETF